MNMASHADKASRTAFSHLNYNDWVDDQDHYYQEDELDIDF